MKKINKFYSAYIIHLEFKNYKTQQKDSRTPLDKLEEINKLAVSINLKINKSEILSIQNPQPGTLIKKGNISKIKNHAL